jgi:hypothetical protein
MCQYRRRARAKKPALRRQTELHCREQQFVLVLQNVATELKLAFNENETTIAAAAAVGF